MQTAPNIVFFMVDQLSAKWLEVASSGVCPTPNTDRLRQRGVTFTHCFTSNPVCMPARATIATGLTTRGHGVLENGYQLDPALPTFMQALQRGGWLTGAFGKVHFHPHYAGLYPDYRPFGFGVTHITEDPRGGEWLDWVEAEHAEWYESALATVWASTVPEFKQYGPGRIDLRSRIQEVRAGFHWATPEFPTHGEWMYALPFPEPVSQTAWITERAIGFLRAVPPDRPLYAHVSYVQPHSPFCAPAEYIRRVDTSEIPRPLPAEWFTDPHAPRYFSGRQPVEADWATRRHCYFADISHLDHQLGRIVAALEDTGRADNTYLIFLSDHGELLGDHGFRNKEERHYDACIRVPLIIAGPGLQPGRDCHQIVQLEDMCPTVLDMVSLRLPPMPRMGPFLQLEAEAIPRLPGRSLLPICRGEHVEGWRQAAYCESYNTLWSVDPGDWARTIRTHSYRYTFYANGNGDQMFDLRTDPDEQHNVVADAAVARERQALRDQLLELIVLQDYPKTRRELFALGIH